MQVYEPGGDDQAIRVDDLLGKAGRLPAELGNVAIANPHVGLVSRRPRPVDHRSAFNVEIKLSHLWFPPSMGGKDRSEVTRPPPCLKVQLRPPIAIGATKGKPSPWRVLALSITVDERAEMVQEIRRTVGASLVFALPLPSLS